MPRPVLRTFGAAISVLVVLLGADPFPPPSYVFASGGAAANIPVEVVANGLVFVQAKVNGHPGWFILDNASQGFTVDPEYARAALLPVSDTATARGGGAEPIRAGVVHDVRISLPGLDLTHRHLVVIPLKMLEPAVGHQVDGIIGSRLFDDFVVVADYQHLRLSVYLRSEYRPSGKETGLPVFVDAHGFPFVDASVSLPGITPVKGRFLIDGGANAYAEIYKPFADAHGLPPPAMKLLDAPGTCTGGTTLSRDGRADSIGIGPYSVSHAPITFAQDTEGLMAAKDYAGLFGAEFLRRFTVVFDNPGKRLYLTPNQSYGVAAEYDGSGLRIRAEDPDFHTFVVGRVLPGSPAADAGMKPGDVIEAIGGRAASQFTLTDLRSMLCAPGARCVIAVRRGTGHLRFVVTLRPGV
jgi:hypothetical protein